jgi:hypothetical protein
MKRTPGVNFTLQQQTKFEAATTPKTAPKRHKNARAAVGLAGAGGRPHDDFHARVGRVVGALALFPVGVPQVVHVFLVEGFHRHDFRKLGLEEPHAVFERQARALEEEPVLLPAAVLQLVVALHLTTKEAM